jgi:hypothetical protein
VGDMSRVLAWFSCGAASAVAARVAIRKYGDRCIPVYCDTSRDEHPDNMRFLRDCEAWFGRGVQVLQGKYATADDVFQGTRYMSGPDGARCTVELKKVPRFAFQQADDVHVFGLTSDEASRIADFTQRNPDMLLDWVLLDAGITKDRCYEIIADAGIRLPEMYLMGYPHNNCIGCVKATSPGYWNKIKRDFPAVFESRANRSREIGCRLVRVGGKRIFIDELKGDEEGNWRDEAISCGPDCGVPQMKLELGA